MSLLVSINFIFRNRGLNTDHNIKKDYVITLTNFPYDRKELKQCGIIVKRDSFVTLWFNEDDLKKFLIFKKLS